MGKNFNKIPRKAKEQGLTTYAEILAKWYIKKTKLEYRKKRGQFFTPKRISEFMVRQFENVNGKDNIKILDPGTGIGIFESAICELLISQGKVSRISFDLFENDKKLHPLLNHNMNICKKAMIRNNIQMSYKINAKDFILSNADIFNDRRKDFNSDLDGYDFVICNPPYYKLRKASAQATAMRELSKGQPNIYALFMALAAKLLKIGGQMTILTPRSYCSGLYFRNFRIWFYKYIKPTKIHVFESRKDLFKRDNVIQEMLVFTGIKGFDNPPKVIISGSNGEFKSKSELMVRETNYKEVVIENDDDVIIRIPESELDESIAAEFNKFKFSLVTLGMKVSTGPVVPFRSKKFLLKALGVGGNRDCYPLIWMQNIRDGEVLWPCPVRNKPMAIKNRRGVEKLLIPNNNYVLIKRFSSKEGKRRIYAAVLLKKYLKSDYIGIENHVNYIYKLNGKLTEDEANGIATLLNSKLYNRFFQMQNGNTQVSASEIYNIPLPSIEKITLVGRLYGRERKVGEVLGDTLIRSILSIDKYVMDNLIVNQFKGKPNNN
jgi:adenine-specific DNA-methyltransferase